MNLLDYNYKEVFVVTGEEDQEVDALFVTDNIDDLKIHLSTLSPDFDSGARVFHGVVTSAEFLPNTMLGKSSFVICQDPDDPEKGSVVEASCDTPDELAEDITNVLSEGGLHLFAGVLEMKNIFILYGYQIQTCMSVDSDDFDEEVIEACEKIAGQVELAVRAVSIRDNESGGL